MLISLQSKELGSDGDGKLSLRPSKNIMTHALIHRQPPKLFDRSVVGRLVRASPARHPSISDPRPSRSAPSPENKIP